MIDSIIRLNGDSQVHLWLAFPQRVQDRNLLGQYESLLSDEELHAYKQLVGLEHRREYLISQAFLRDVLSYYTQWEPGRFEFERNECGKPRLRSASGELADLHFNLSHSAELMACAVSRAGKVGVDVEPQVADEGMLGMADHYFSPLEVEELRSLDVSRQVRRFNQVWTLKEAYIKARGEGLSLPLDSFSFEIDEKDGVLLREEQGDLQRSDWSFWSIPVYEHVSAVALEAPAARLRIFSGIPLREMAELELNDLGLVA